MTGEEGAEAEAVAHQGAIGRRVAHLLVGMHLGEEVREAPDSRGDVDLVDDGEQRVDARRRRLAQHIGLRLGRLERRIAALAKRARGHSRILE